MLKLIGSLSASFHPTGHEPIHSETFANNPVARRIGRGGRLFKKTAPRTAAPLNFGLNFAAERAGWSSHQAPQNDKSNSKLSVSDWNLMASRSLDALREGAVAALEQPALLFGRSQPLTDMPADFWQDLPEMAFNDGPVAVKPIAFARRSVQAGRADEPAGSLH